MFERVIDLGCGEPDPGFIGSLPAHAIYIGVDLVDFSTSSTFQRPQSEFIRSGAIDALAELRPSSSDLVVSTFAAHHIGVGAMISACDRLRERSVQYLVVDAALRHRTSFSLHYLRSIVAGLTGLPSSSFANGNNADRLRRSQLGFLLTPRGLTHAHSDFIAERQFPASALKQRGDLVAFSSLWCLAGGTAMRGWLAS